MDRPKTERKIDIACLIILPSIFLILAILSYQGKSTANFGDSYVFATEMVSMVAVMILPALRVARRFYAPYWFIAMVSLVVYLHSISLYLGFYQMFSWWDAVNHGYSSAVVTTVVFIALLTINRYSKCIDLGKTGLAFATFVIGFGFGNAWEIWEWFVDNAFGDDYMSYSIFDTLGDILHDGMGALIVAVVAAIAIRRWDTDRLVDGMGLEPIMSKIGRKWDRKCGCGSESGEQ